MQPACSREGSGGREARARAQDRLGEGLGPALGVAELALLLSWIAWLAQVTQVALFGLIQGGAVPLNGPRALLWWGLGAYVVARLSMVTELLTGPRPPSEARDTRRRRAAVLMVAWAVAQTGLVATLYLADRAAVVAGQLEGPVARAAQDGRLQDWLAARF